MSPPRPNPAQQSSNSEGLKSLQERQRAASMHDQDKYLPKMNMDDYVPSIQRWQAVSGVAVLLSAGFGLVFMVFCPYRVVVRGPGAVRPTGEQVVVNAPFEGRVLSVDVRINQPVKAGQAIVTLDRSKISGEIEEAGKNKLALQSQLFSLRQQAAAEYSRALLEVEKARSELSFAQTEFDRYKILQKEGAASASLFEGRKATLNQARAGLGQSIEGLEAVRSQSRTREAQLLREFSAVDRASSEGARNLSNTTIRSPVSGIVFILKVQNPQQTVGAGQELAVITPSTAARIVKVQVRSEDIDQVRLGQPAELRLAGCPYPDYGTLPAKVIAVSPDALPVRLMDTSEVGSEETAKLYEVTLRPASTELKAGSMRCSVKLGMQLHADIITRQESLLRFVLRKTRLMVGK